MEKTFLQVRTETKDKEQASVILEELEMCIRDRPYMVRCSFLRLQNRTFCPKCG